MKELKKLVFKNYPITVELSKKQRTQKYIFSKTKLLKKFLAYNVKETENILNEFSYTLCDLNINIKPNNIIKNQYNWRREKIKGSWELILYENDKVVASNPRRAGKPKLKIINGQELHQLTMVSHVKSKIVNFLKEYFLTELKLQSLEQQISFKFPIFIEYVFFSKIMNSDLNNHSLFYEKTFTDIIQNKIILTKEDGKVFNELGILPDDSVRYLNGYSINFCQLDEVDECNNYLMITIYQDNNYNTFINRLKEEYIENNLIQLL
jgi:hypothetical protein